MSSIPRLGRRVLTTLAALAFGLGAGAFAVPPGARASIVRLGISAASPGRPMPPNFLGLALEYRAVPMIVGPDPSAVDPVFVQLLHNIDPGGRPVLRIGGQSTDRTWWPVPGTPRPLGVTYALTPGWINAARGLVAATQARLILGIGLEANRPRIDAVEAAQLTARLGRAAIAALEIGNEPELYTIVPWYLRLRGVVEPWYGTSGQRVFARPPAYNFAAFSSDFSRALAALPPGIPIAGPSTGIFGWLQGFHRYESRRSPVRIVSWHEYGLNDCVTNPSSPSYPSVPHLLTLTASRSTIGPIGPEVAIAHANGEQFRVDEMGSVSCNGRLGVSDTMATALWVMDTLFAINANGVDGVDLHTQPNLDNGLFDFTRPGGQWTGEVHPIYYGALMFAQAAPPGSRLLSVRAAPAGETTLRAWATLGADGQTRVLLINDSLRHAALTFLTPAAAPGPAAIERLAARSAYATTGLTLGGRTFGTTTTTGILAAPTPASLQPAKGRYRIVVAPAGAALVTIPKGR